ncbi:hypothetical protein BN873_720017 [Candidatus Competibacter denitrificans Run_A_D11]|uniref:Uncharacterized protein n=1 Tax=Candidatus Competibacter denitrificans Run_A_D11 TaxID=1400863 RepID=W6ME35_9GAMM|nr:hypothetical protein BN873_720017 [Candidatus Competibacter denitrificans Run_A_D11]
MLIAKLPFFSSMQNQLAWQITAHRVESPHRPIYALGCCDLSTEHGDRRLPPLQFRSYAVEILSD